MKQTKLEFSFAKPANKAFIKKLLSECGLPHEDISGHLEHFIVAKKGTVIVGVVGLEVLCDMGLLRSLAVATPYRGQGLAKALCRRMEDYASSRGIKELYLLTLTAEGLFKKLDYLSIERSSVPQPIQATGEFSSICPASSACMMKRIEKWSGQHLPRH